MVEILFKQYGVVAIVSSPYHPEGNSHMEHLHQTLVNSILRACGKNVFQWPLYLHTGLWAMWCSTLRVTGYPPYFLLYGHFPFFAFDFADRTWDTLDWHNVTSTEDLLALWMQQILRRDKKLVQLWTTKAHKLVILVGSWWICEIFSESCSDFQKTSKTPPPKFFPCIVSNGQIFGVNTYWQKWVWAMKMSWGELRTMVKGVSAIYNHCGLSEAHSLLSTSLFPCQSHGWEFMGCINAQAVFVLWQLQNLLSQCCGLWPIMETNEWYNWAPFWKKKVSSVKVKHFFVSQPHDEFIWNELHKVPFSKGSDCTFFQIFPIPFREFGQNFRDNFLKWKISLERLDGTFQNLVRSFS